MYFSVSSIFLIFPHSLQNIFKISMYNIQCNSLCSLWILIQTYLHLLHRSLHLNTNYYFQQAILSHVWSLCISSLSDENLSFHLINSPSQTLVQMLSHVRNPSWLPPAHFSTTSHSTFKLCLYFLNVRKCIIGVR